MKNRISLFTIIVVAIAFSSCNPIEDRKEMTGSTTMAKIDQYVSVTQETREGFKSNYINLLSDGLDALSAWDYGSGSFYGTKGRVQLVLPGENTITFTALNADGTQLTKQFTVIVDSCFDVPPQWAMLCGDGSKVWTWDPGLGEQAYGMGDALWSSAGDWWAPGLAGEAEGIGATMTFSVRGSAFTKTLTDGSSVNGTFSFNMDNVAPNYSRSTGELSTSIPVLMGQTTGAATGNGASGKDVTVYEIIKLDDDNLQLSWLEKDGDGKPIDYDSQGWGQGTLWIFTPAE